MNLIDMMFSGSAANFIPGDHCSSIVKPYVGRNWQVYTRFDDWVIETRYTSVSPILPATDKERWGFRGYGPD